MKGLIINEPWMTKILEGKKIWEMRKRSCKIRGPIALIRKGSGMIVGTADVSDSLAPLQTREHYARAEPFHAIPPVRQERAFEDGWVVPWVLGKARALSRPIPYAHPSGAVIWVNLNDDISRQVISQMQQA